MGKHLLNFGSAHAALAKRFSPINKVVKRDDCTPATFYKLPTQGSTVSLNDELHIQWDASCLGTPEAVDISLLSISTNNTANALVGAWKGIHFASGEYSAAVDSRWFDGKANAKYQISIKLQSTIDSPSFLAGADQYASFASGPAWTGTYNATAAGSSASLLNGNTPDRTVVVNNSPPKGLTKGQVAAAVIMPILVVAACIAGYVFWSRKKEAARRREYRENIDQRMSIAPGADWAPISAAGAAAAIRHSMAISTTGGGDRNTRASSFFGRQSTYQADPPQEMRQTSRARNMSSEQSRTSRISFAETAHPRQGDRPAVPPLPQAYRKSAYSAGDHDTNGDALSPTQREGALALDEDSIRDRLSGASANNNNGEFGQDADTMPALAMMRANDGSTSPTPPAPVLTRESTVGDYRTYSIGAYSGNTDSIVTDSNAPSYFNPPSNSADPDEALRNYATRNPQMLPVTTTASPFSGFAAGPGLAAAAGFDMSPDAIFRAYAATRPAQPPATVDPTTPNTPGAMRNLYNPTMMQGLGLRQRADTMNSVGNNNPYRDSMAPGGDYDVGKAH
ncbi:hypothetical protein M408DRAFT_107214 [Serendipita vermifera MAFF 305830]|uniref:Uncharacterized protein n=1 Tax=Serendipita vermifera MAFF 305830 TaxID=933852 RepID=A0A0C2XL71_SERVB|nr:hypothetical protein M408DRAFT_107214 [Serendipita vermifera MAFF 305830]